MEDPIAETTQPTQEISKSMRETMACTDQCVVDLKRIAKLMGLDMEIPTETNQNCVVGTRAQETIEIMTTRTIDFNNQDPITTAFGINRATTSYPKARISNSKPIQSLQNNLKFIFSTEKQQPTQH